MKDVPASESYPLSALQQGMLFHTLSSPGSGVDIEQILCTLGERLDISAFERAWKRVIARHPILRTRFHWEGLAKPLQVVEPQVEIKLQYQDWRQVPAGECDQRIEAYLRTDRLHDFKMNLAPLMSLVLFELDDSQYQFLWTFHHALLDGRSFPLIITEVFNTYDGLVEDRDHILDQPRPYREYIDWLQQQKLTRAETYLRETLKGFTTATQLGVARTSDETSRVAGDMGAEEISLSLEHTASLRSFAAGHELTLNTLIQGAWALLLHHYSNEEDVVFGTVRACRHWTRNGAESMIGLFINTLPIRVQISLDQPLLSWLQQLRKQNLALRKYEHTPLPKIQQWSDITPGKTLFETLVVFENHTLNQALRAQGNNWPQRKFHYRGQTNSPLTLLGYADPEMLLRIEYDRTRFEQPTIKRMLGHLQTLLEAMLTQPDMPAARLPYLTAQERQQLLLEWNDTGVAYYLDKCLHQLFEAQVERTPDAVALVFEDSRLTYGQLNRKANNLAHYLRHLGVGPDVPVGICAERSFEMVIGLYAILKAGGAYVPLDPDYPQERMAFMLEDAQVAFILTQQKLIDVLPPNDARIVCLDDPLPGEVLSQRQNTGVFGDGNQPCRTRPDNLAYVIFTSGSTGRPKGVMNTHRAICNRLLWMQDAFHLTGSDAVLQKTPFSFDVSVWEFFWPLLTGARLVIARPEGHKDSSYLIEAVRKNRVTTIHFVPSMLQIFLEDPDVESCDSLKRVICSGEALPYELQERFFKRLNAELHNLYGPTEAAVDVTYWKCKPEGSLRIVPIGRSIANTRMYILDRHLQPVPIGVSGELHIGGVQVARGYVNRPEWTDEKFISDPFCDDPEARLYKTGDLCRYLPDGNIEYMGRNDFQVKIRGFRIEIGEIESVLSRHPAVREVVVSAREDNPGNKRLIAYLAPKQAPPGVDELRGFLKQRLPDYMLPAAFVFLNAFPLTFSGKVDRRALPAPAEERQTEKSYIAPQNEVEKIITSIWQEILKVNRVGVNDNFFDLGGHSLLLVRMQTRLRESFAREIPISEIFRYPTVSLLAKFLAHKNDSDLSFNQIYDRAKKQRQAFIQRKEISAERRRIYD